MENFISLCNTNQGFLTVMLTFVYVAATVWLVCLSSRQLRLARELEESRIRPFVIFELTIERHFVYAVIQNFGATPASKVQISVCPNIQCLLGGDNVYPSEERAIEIAFIERGIETLAPRREIKSLVGPWTRVKAAHPNLRFEGILVYSDSNSKKYSETFVADLSFHEGVRSITEKGIRDIANELSTISRSLDHLASGFKSPLVRTISEQEYLAKQDGIMEQAMKELEQRQGLKENQTTL